MARKLRDGYEQDEVVCGSGRGLGIVRGTVGGPDHGFWCYDGEEPETVWEEEPAPQPEKVEPIPEPESVPYGYEVVDYRVPVLGDLFLGKVSGHAIPAGKVNIAKCHILHKITPPADGPWQEEGRWDGRTKQEIKNGDLCIGEVRWRGQAVTVFQPHARCLRFILEPFTAADQATQADEGLCKRGACAFDSWVRDGSDNRTHGQMMADFHKQEQARKTHLTTE